MNRRSENRSETPIEAVEHALMLAEGLQLTQDVSETEELRREILRIYRFQRRYMDADALRMGKLKQQKELISVSALLHGIFREAQCEMILRGMTIEEDTDVTAFVYGDAEILRRVLWNLLQNAMSAAGDRGKIVLRLRNFGESCRITVLDNGAGFGEDDPQELFRNASEISGFGTIRLLLGLYQTELSFERQGEQTAVSFLLPRVMELPELHAPEAGARYLLGLKDVEVELSALERVE